jgi:hypothetical protein
MPRTISADGRSGKQTVVTDLSLEQAVKICRELRDSFAQSLAAEYDRYGRFNTGNKAAWCIVKAQQSLNRARQQDERPREQLGNFAAIQALFALAGSRLQFPKIELDTADGRTVVLGLAGSRSAHAGKIKVSSGHKYGDPAGRFYGWIAPDGSTQASDQGVLELLRKFAADPQGVAAEYGRRTGSCCFCRQGLTDERSLLVGYGPVCAKNYGLPWGDRPGPGGPPVQQQFSEFPAEVQQELDRDVEFSRLERQQEQRGFSSDPDYSGFRVTTDTAGLLEGFEQPSRLLSFEEFLDAASATAVRDGYLLPRAEAGQPLWQPDDRHQSLVGAGRDDD